MGIYIEGLDWPELGMPITITLFNDGAVNEEGIADYQAIEVKTPHGRLIDGDKLLHMIENKTAEPDYQHTGEDWKVGLYFVEDLAYELPTVIEAEVE